MLYVFYVLYSEDKMKDRLRLIEMQDIASVARDNMGDYRRVENWGYKDKIASFVAIGLVILFVGVVFI